jgi:hypothetical protein
MSRPRDATPAFISVGHRFARSLGDGCERGAVRSQRSSGRLGGAGPGEHDEPAVTDAMLAGSYESGALRHQMRILSMPSLTVTASPSPWPASSVTVPWIRAVTRPDCAAWSTSLIV